MDFRYLIIVLGNYKKIEDDLMFVASSDHGVNYVGGNGVFLGTFYSEMTTEEMHKSLSHIPAFLIFDISDNTKNIVNLPSKYFKGLFPEIGDTLEKLNETIVEPIVKNISKPTTIKKVEEYDNVNDILDKLSRNKYDRSCLTKKEIKILEEVVE